MAQDPTLDDLLARLRAGDNDAAAEIFHRFARRLLGLARNRLRHLPPQKVDPEDVLQSVFRSFFRMQAKLSPKQTNWDSLWGLLTLITVRKCGRQLDYFHAQGRDHRKEVAAPASADSSGAGWEAIAREPTPSEAAMLAETVEQLMRELKERERPILELSLQGHSVAKISEKVRRTERTVHRVLRAVRLRLEQMRTGEGEGA